LEYLFLLAIVLLGVGALLVDANTESTRHALQQVLSQLDEDKEE